MWNTHHWGLHNILSGILIAIMSSSIKVHEDKCMQVHVRVAFLSKCVIEEETVWVWVFFGFFSVVDSEI